VHIQHEFGIFGESYGKNLILLLRNLKKPTIITFHTALPNPNPELKDIVSAINNHVQKIIVMTEMSKQIIINEYGIDSSKISVIPHGIHPVNFSDGANSRADLGLSKKTIISTFGLLSQGKGIEYGIEAMVEVVKKDPTAVYLIIGATHPVVLKNDGEIYRNSLIKKIRQLNLKNHVFFYDKYLAIDELLHFLDATDIYLALSQDPNQAVSGTLSYALGSGRPVVSTSFAHAKEDVTNDTGILVDFKDVNGISDALLLLIGNKELRKNMGKNAYFKTRSRTWRNIALGHMTEYIKLAPELAIEEKNLPKIKLSHINTMTDSFGIFQFAKLLVPDPLSGYTIDDNSRALLAVTKYYDIYKKKNVLHLINTYLDFIEYVQKEHGGFHNYVEFDKKIPHDQHVKMNLESAGTKGIYALSMVASSKSLPSQFQEKAINLFEKNIHVLDHVTSPRSVAFAIKSLCAWYAVKPSDDIKNTVSKLADLLVKYFENSSSQEWKWFEEILAYSNGILPNSLIDAYKLIKKEKYLTVARESLDFLILQSFEGELCMPIGQNGWHKKGGKKQTHDQQPEEVASLVSALKAMYDITRDEKYNRRMRNAFDWFLGNNILHGVVYNQATGGCYDGLGKKEINLNQGAESTIMYLLARLEYE